MCQIISTFARCLLIGVNTLTLLLGVSFIVVGSLIMNDRSFISDLISNKTEETTIDAHRTITKDVINSELDIVFLTAGGIILGVGLFIALLSGVGCFAVFKKSKCLLMTYVFVVTILTLLQTIAIILAAIYQNELIKHITTFLKTTLKEYGGDQHVRELWNGKMKNFDCCGVTGFKDFDALMENTTDRAKQGLFDACCDQGTVTCSDFSYDNLTDHNTKNGCSDKAFKAFKDHYYADIVVVAVLIITNGLAIAAALGMKHTNDEEEDDKTTYERPKQHRDSTKNNLQNLSQMRNPSARDSVFMYENA